MRILEKGSFLFSLEHLGMEEKDRNQLDKIIQSSHGIMLVTGPTGSGKSTTLYAALQRVNSPDKNIITVEDPIEYQLEGIGQIQVAPKIGLTFAAGLRSILRQDPDIILIGEIRDMETAEMAVQASLTGHLVFSTLHTTGCQGTVNRIIDAFPHEQQDQIRVQLSTSLIAILSQALMPRKPSGMVAAYEFLVVTPAISNLIRENKTFRIDSAIQTGKKYGMQLLDDHLWTLYERGMIDAAEMLDKARHAGEIQEKLEKAGKLHEAGEALITIHDEAPSDEDEGTAGKK